MSIIIRLIAGVISVWLTVVVGKGVGLGLAWQGLGHAILFVIVMGFVNALIRPIVKLLTLPLTCLTLGLFSLVVNAVLFWGTANLTGGLKVDDFWAALFGSILLGILGAIVNSMVKAKSGHKYDSVST